MKPSIDPKAFVAPNATVVGDVTLGPETSVWFGCVLRGDVEPIRVGDGTNIQDLSVVHVTSGQGPAVIGNEVTVGHRAVIHGCTIHDRSLVGIGAIVLDGAEVGPEALVGAGALVPPGMRVPPGALVLGTPARVVRQLTEEEIKNIAQSAFGYKKLCLEYAGLNGA